MIARLLISNSPDNLKQEVEKHLEKLKLKNPHPDLLFFPSDSKLGISEARKIKEHFSLKPYSSKGRVVVLEDASSLTDEAQNALLKTLEELPEYALFIMCASSDATLLPTVLSRCQIVILQKISPQRTTPGVEQSENIEKLLASTIAQRFEYVEKLKEREELLRSLISYFHKKLPEYPKFTKDILQAEEWQKQNVNLRAILEYLMLVMPQK